MRYHDNWTLGSYLQAPTGPQFQIPWEWWREGGLSLWRYHLYPFAHVLTARGLLIIRPISCRAVCPSINCKWGGLLTMLHDVILPQINAAGKMLAVWPRKCENKFTHTRDLILWDSTLSAKTVMLIMAPLVQATRLSCSQQSLLSAGGRLQLHLVAGITGAQISITCEMYRSASSPTIRSLRILNYWNILLCWGKWEKRWMCLTHFMVNWFE